MPATVPVSSTQPVTKRFATRRRHLFGWALLALVAGLVLFLLWAHRPAIAEVAPPSRRAFDPADVARGRNLALVGNCVSCHQAPHGRPYAGGYGVVSPFGTIYGTNITPDPDTGIGRWSEAAFARSMREGVSRDGHHLYPAFPYDHYQRTTDADLRALYAFLMTRDPVRAEPRANDMPLPFKFRPFIAGWKLLFVRDERHRPDPRRSAEWNRGAYLGEGLAHCGGCHTPRGLLGAEKRDRAYDGGWSAGWYAPPMNARSPAVRAWTVERMEQYLRTGLSLSHAAAAGPMGAVAANLSRADPRDVRALSVYYAWWMRDAGAARREPRLIDRAAAAARAHPAGAALFAGACATCHEPGAPMMVEGRPALPLGSPLHEDHADDTVNIILHGLEPPVGRAGPYMPAYKDALTDAQVAAIVRYMRIRYGSGSEWPDLEDTVAKARERTAE